MCWCKLFTGEHLRHGFFNLPSIGHWLEHFGHHLICTRLSYQEDKLGYILAKVFFIHLIITNICRLKKYFILRGTISWSIQGAATKTKLTEYLGVIVFCGKYVKTGWFLFKRQFFMKFSYAIIGYVLLFSCPLTGTYGTSFIPSIKCTIHNKSQVLYILQ